MRSYSSKLRRSSGVWILLSFMAVFALTFSVVLYFSEQNRIEKVTSIAPDGFPLVIFTRNNADVIFYGDIDYYTRANPEYTFLASTGQETTINEMLTESLRKKHSSASPEIKVEQISPGRQSIKLGLYGDGETIVWYEATDKKIYPKAIKQLGTMFMAIVLVESFAVSIIIGALAMVSLKISRGF